MLTITYILKDGTARTLPVAAGISVMQAAVQNNIPGIDGECGGCLSCATCHVYVAEQDWDRLEAADETEAELLTAVAAEQRPTSRLCCQIRMSPALDGLTVHVPDCQS